MAAPVVYRISSLENLQTISLMNKDEIGNIYINFKSVSYKTSFEKNKNYSFLDEPEWRNVSTRRSCNTSGNVANKRFLHLNSCFLNNLKSLKILFCIRMTFSKLGLAAATTLKLNFNRQLLSDNSDTKQNSHCIFKLNMLIIWLIDFNL
jgi:hypothetical protein